VRFRKWRRKAGTRRNIADNLSVIGSSLIMTGLQALAAFTEAARGGSFAAAARSLGLSPSAVAKSVQRLERDVGLRLFHRTTRQVSLTADGRELYARSERVLAELEALRSRAEDVRGEPSGLLRLDVPSTLGRLDVVPLLAQLGGHFPKLQFEVSFSDRYVDLVREGIDVAVRIGALADSTLTTRPLGEQALLTVAAPGYLRRRDPPPPRRPAAVEAHACLLFRNPSSGRLRPWQFREGRRTVEFVPAARFVFNDGEAIVAAASAGMGIAQVPDNMARGALRDRALVEILREFRPPSLPISIVYPSGRHVPPRLRVLIDLLASVGLNRGGDDRDGRRRR
jgi:LysR family transcriptional regulator for bpeEF and oprC